MKSCDFLHYFYRGVGGLPLSLAKYNKSQRQALIWITLGISESGKLLVVSHTFLEESLNLVKIRIFSSRKATKGETEKYIKRKIRTLVLPRDEFKDFKTRVQKQPHVLIWEAKEENAS